MKLKLKATDWTCLWAEAGGAVAVLLLGLLLFVAPLSRQRSEIRAEIRDVHNEVDERMERVAELATVADEVGQLKRDVEALRDWIERSPDLESVSRDLRHAAREYALFPVLDGTWDSAGSGSHVRTFTKEVVLLGPFDRLGQYLEFIETRPYFLGVASVALVPTEAGAQGDLKAELELIYRISTVGATCSESSGEVTDE